MKVVVRVTKTIAAAALLTLAVTSSAELATSLVAARAGNADEMHNVGVAYAKGEAVARDYAEAMRWFEAAALKGQHNSMYSLGVMYALGQGVAPDLVKAYAWYSLAAEYIPKDADEWFIPRAKVAMYLRRPDEVAQQLSEPELRRAKELREDLRKRIEVRSR